MDECHCAKIPSHGKLGGPTMSTPGFNDGRIVGQGYYMTFFFFYVTSTDDNIA